MTQTVHPVAAVEAVRWSPEGALRIIDQRRLPGEVVELDLRTTAEVAEAIRTLAVRGAGLLGVTAAMALAQAAALAADREPSADGRADTDRVMGAVRAAAATLRATRPTAANLGWALDRMLARVTSAAESLEVPAVEPTAAEIVAALQAEADAVLAEDRAMCLAIGEHGAALLHHGMRILTHGNSGALATGGLGTALAPIYVAHARGVVLRVYAGETRPLLQGARLTSWELTQAGVPVTLLADSAAASLMESGHVDMVLVGADRIAANGDVASKIGTLALAVLAHHHRIPFIVAAPRTTIDPRTETGADIPIEQRAPDEVLSIGGARVGAEGVAVHNPAFDVTPAALVTHYITDSGIEHAPFRLDVSCVKIPPPA